jgi:tRNA G18 (ribose-2'-O)-methylase SpoU
MMDTSLNRKALRRQLRHVDYRSATRHPIVVLADNLDKSSNIGSILRMADAFMVETVLASRPQPDFAGAMGAEHWQPVEWSVDLAGAVTQYRSRGFAIVALEQTATAEPINEFDFPERVLLVVGAEMFGVSPDILAMCDSVVYIPQCGLIKSLNVAAATGMALYEYSRQWWMRDFKQPARHLAPAEQSTRMMRKTLAKLQKGTEDGRR